MKLYILSEERLTLYIEIGVCYSTSNTENDQSRQDAELVGKYVTEACNIFLWKLKNNLLHTFYDYKFEMFQAVMIFSLTLFLTIFRNWHFWYTFVLNMVQLRLIGVKF